jgi:hypothetical protein
MAWHEILEKWRGNITWGVARCISGVYGRRGRGTREHVQLDKKSKEDSNAVDAKQAVCIRHAAHGAWAVREQG